CCLQHTDVHECLGSTDHGDKPKALLGIEPFDDCFDRLRCLRRARPWIARPPFDYSILGGVIVIVTAALGLTVVFVAAHSMSIRIRQQQPNVSFSPQIESRGPPRKFAIRQATRKRGGSTRRT